MILFAGLATDVLYKPAPTVVGVMYAIRKHITALVCEPMYDNDDDDDDDVDDDDDDYDHKDKAIVPITCLTSLKKLNG